MQKTGKEETPPPQPLTPRTISDDLLRTARELNHPAPAKLNPLLLSTRRLEKVQTTLLYATKDMTEALQASRRCAIALFNRLPCRARLRLLLCCVPAAGDVGPADCCQQSRERQWHGGRGVDLGFSTAFSPMGGHMDAAVGRSRHQAFPCPLVCYPSSSSKIGTKCMRPWGWLLWFCLTRARCKKGQGWTVGAKAEN